MKKTTILFNYSRTTWANIAALQAAVTETDIIQPDIHKANGLKELGDILGIKLSEMCAFGDGGNDLEMLREVGDGVAMKKAVPALLEVANHVTDTNDEEGVLNYIEKNIL